MAILILTPRSMDGIGVNSIHFIEEKIMTPIQKALWGFASHNNLALIPELASSSRTSAWTFLLCNFYYSSVVAESACKALNISSDAITIGSQLIVLSGTFWNMMNQHRDEAITSPIEKKIIEILNKLSFLVSVISAVALLRIKCFALALSFLSSFAFTYIVDAGYVSSRITEYHFYAGAIISLGFVLKDILTGSRVLRP